MLKQLRTVSRNSKKGLLAVLAILLLLISVALLSEAIDSIGSVPNLGINLGQLDLEQNVTKLPDTVEFTENCDIDNFLSETEGSPDLSISGIPGTSYLRAIVFERFEEGKWTAPPSMVAQYTGEYLPPGVQTFTSRDYRDVIITPLKEMTGYIPAELHLETLVSTAQLTYDEELRVFFSSSTFTSSYELSYCVYQYDINLLESAQAFDDLNNLQIPNGDVDWLREIAEEVTRNSSSTYRKILSLISYLKENYTYNLEYEQAPTGVNPVEWFLTANKEGVCTHFNSALVLLARSIGLPSRLAGGYFIDSQVEEQEVYPIQRHAFAEFHFEDLGWIIFDATPSGDCSECESAGPEENGEVVEEEPIQPIDEVFNETECQDCVNNYTKMSPEGGMPPDIPLFEIYGVTGSGYLRTMVGEFYDGFWEMTETAPFEYIGELIPYPISGTRTSSIFTISPLAEMGGYIPTVKYTNTLSLDSHVQFYPDQLIFFSSRILENSYTVTSSYYVFTNEALRAAEPVNDERYLNVPDQLKSILRELALKETSDADTPYEKYEALGSFLRSNYEYDLNYTRAPAGIDPVEWFLFHEKRGVCANFNSAFVLLARSIGLPARLVGGYAIDAGSNWQVVNASQAHAYSEAPFDNWGWITFDATGSGGGTGGEVGEEFEIEPIDEVFNETECQDCVNNCTKHSAEGGLPQKVDLFYIFGVTGTGYLRTGVGEYYDGIWEMVDPAPEAFHGGVLEYPVTGFSEATKHRFMVAPLVEMGGFIPVAQYSNELVLDSRVQWYADQQLFFSNDYFTSSYIVAHNGYSFSYQSLEAASLWEDVRYLNVPSNLLSKLRILAQEVTYGYDSPYLKIVALRDYVSSEYEYDLNYTRAPAGIDPVEWFLFHEKRGVCANFNSAFVLLARSIGLPARYVVGYGIQPDVETQKVTSIQAHGYAEFPFMDLGWIIFDATGPGWFPFEEEPEVPPILETATEITEQDELGVKGLDFDVMGSVIDENGDPVDGLRTLVYIKETKDEDGLLCGEGPVVDGWFNITCSLPMNLTNGYYLVQAHTLGDHRYNGSWSDPPLKVVTQSELSIEAPEKVITGRAFIFQGNLSEYLSGLPISNQSCTIESFGENAIFETDINGFFAETWIFHQPGNYSLRVEWSGAEFFLGSNASSPVRSVPLSIKPEPIEMMIRQESIIIMGRVHAEELSGDNETVILTLDDEVIGSVRTDENGLFAYPYTVPETQELGEVLIGYSLASSLDSVMQTSYVYARTFLQLVAPSLLELKKDFTLKGNLTDDLDIPIGFVNLTVVNKEENKTSTLLTDQEGMIEVPLRIDRTPDYASISYNVSFEGVGYYLETYDEVVVPIDIPLNQELDVLQIVTYSLIMVAVALVGYVAYTFLKKRRKMEVDELDDAEGPKDIELLVELSPGIHNLDERFEVEFPQIATSFPMVWGVEEEFIVQLRLVRTLETFGGKLDVTIILDGEEDYPLTIFSDKTVDYPVIFNRKGSHHLQVVFEDQESQRIACDIVVKIVDYREEVNDLFNDEFEVYRSMREEIKNHFTAREFMHSILKGKSERYYPPLNEMVSVFEMADYSLHQVRRSEYERFIHAKQEFGEIKIGN